MKRVHLIRWAITVQFILSAVAAWPQKAEHVSKLSLTVTDIERSVEFYTRLLDFEIVGRYEWKGEGTRKLFGIDDEMLNVRVARLRLGAEEIELMEFSQPGRPIPADSRSNDLWFQHMAIVVSSMDRAYQRLWQHKVTHVSTAPQTLPDYIPAAAGITAFYFRDPDGHNLELIHFPKGKGNSRWQKPTKQTFLGIDHTAIGVADTERALAFYKTGLQLSIGGSSENHGTQQEHLNQLFGARLLITGLHAANGVGVEFLDYIAPPGGRLYPPDSTPADLWHWHVSMKVDRIDVLYEALLLKNYRLVSSGITVLEDGTRAFMVRDPDGHAILAYQ